MTGRLVWVLRAADDRPARTVAAVTVAGYVGLLVWAHFSDAPVLLARAGADDRVRIYTQFTGAATALLGTSLTVLAILLALPDRPAVQDLRDGPAWPRMQTFLICTATLCLITLVGSFLGSGLDHSAKGREWVGFLLLVPGAMSTVCVLLSGLAFGLFLRRAGQAPDPSRGRGSGAST